VSVKKIAVFDIDGTLYRWQLFHELVEELTRAEVFPDNTFREVDTAWNDWRGGNLHFHGYESLVVETLMKYLPLIPIKTFEAVCDKVIVQSSHKLHAYPKQLLKTLRNQGYTIAAISGSQQELLDRFAAKHDIDIAIGAVYERKDGHFTGETSRMTIGRKAVIFQELINEHSFSLEGSVAIGDSDGDIELLSAVEKPIAFNPSEGLFEHAKTAGWPIVIERKNIAYHLERKDDALVLAETIIY
jgi:HAD superfamily hydrolase (TIGR01490 family)